MPTSLYTHFQEVRKLTESIAAPIEAEDSSAQPIADVSPPKWHLAHTTWFFEQFILRDKKGYNLFHPDFNFLFNSYYNSMGERIDRNTRGSDTRPLLSEIRAYRRHVDQAMLELLRSETDKKTAELVILGLNHEQQHQELLIMDIKYIFGTQPLFPAFLNSPQSNSLKENREVQWIHVEEGIYEVGFQGNAFSYDNEHCSHKVYLNAFQIADQPVTNAEWLEFMADEGYGDFQFWLSDGWDWVKNSGAKSPAYWVEKEGRWYYYTLNGLRELDLAAPVCHVNYYEADAFAKWSGMRLPRETEWEVAAMINEPSVPATGDFSDKMYFQPQAWEKGGFAGSVWEWTNSAYLAYPGYTQEKGALGEYNGKWMSGQMVLRGGSCATPHSHYRHTYRNFFQPDKRWQFSGLRLAKDI